MSTWYAEYVDDLGAVVSESLNLPLAWLDYSTATEKLVSQSAIRLWDVYFAVIAEDSATPVCVHCDSRTLEPCPNCELCPACCDCASCEFMNCNERGVMCANCDHCVDHCDCQQ